MDFMNGKKELYYKYFEDKILVNLKSAENYRLGLLRKACLSSLFFFLAGSVFAYIFIILVLQDVFNPFLFPFILFCMYAFIIKGIINFILAGKAYQEKLQSEVFPLFLPPVANFKSWPKNSNTEAILESQLFHNFDTQEDDSSFFGFYSRTNIILSNTCLKMPVKGANRPNMFKGTLIQLELDKSVNNHVILFSKNEHKYNNFHQVNPHIDDLNQYLYVFARDTKNISFINDDFWNVIKKFGEVYTAKSFSLSLKDNVVLIALRQKQPMQFGCIVKSLLRVKNYDELIDKFIVIYDLIDVLNKV